MEGPRGLLWVPALGILWRRQGCGWVVQVKDPVWGSICHPHHEAMGSVWSIFPLRFLVSLERSFEMLERGASVPSLSTKNGTCHGCLPSASTRIKSCAAVATDLQHALEEFKVESRREALCAPGNWQARSLDSQMFLGADFMNPLLISPHM